MKCLMVGQSGNEMSLSLVIRCLDQMAMRDGCGWMTDETKNLKLAKGICFNYFYYY